MPRRTIPKECRARILSAFEEYAFEVDRSDRSPSTKKTYISHAWRFVRWIEEPEVLDQHSRKEARLPSAS